MDVAPANPTSFVTASLLDAMRSLPDGLVLFDREWRIAYANDLARKISHIREEDLNGPTQWEFFPATVGTSLEAAYRGVMRDRIEVTLPPYYYAPFDQWYAIRVFPTECGVGLQYRDVTIETRAEQARLVSEDRTRIALEAANGIGMWEWNIAADRVRADARFSRLFGVDPAIGAAGAPLADFTRNIHPEDRERVEQSVREALTTGEYRAEYRLLQPDGSVRWLDTRGTVIYGLDAQPQSFPGVAIDITEQKEQFAENERHRRELETIYQTSPIGMALYDAATMRLTRLNEQQARIFGMPREQALGKTFAELTSGVGQGVGLIHRAAEGESVLNQNIDGTLATRLGEHRYWNVNYSPIFTENGSVQSIAGATIETTRERLAEQALLQSEKLAAVGRMASSIAHEINNPLESVTNLLYLARSMAVRDDVKTYLEMADAELRRVSIIANQTLRFHKQASAPREVAAADLFSTVLSLYEGRLRNAHIQLDRSRLSAVRIGCFDGDIRQVLNNLVGNALDAMPGGGKLILRAQPTTDWPTGRPGLALTVADSGTGMTPDVQRRIFDAFYTTKGISGTGLGLWISAEIVERHHGRLQLRSSTAVQHHGTVFRFFLPFDTTGERPTTSTPEG